MRFLIVIFAAVVLCARAAYSDPLAVELASNHIDITTGFTGSTIQVFGYRGDKDADLAIIVRGPERDVTVWRKANIFGMWVNRYYVTFDNMPLYYNYAIANKEAKMANVDVMRANGVGVQSLFPADNKEIKDPQIYRDALIAQREQHGLFPADSVKIEFINDYFFRAEFQVPAAAPTGEYKVQSLLFRGGRVKEKDLEILKVEQVGLNAYVYKSARDYAILYGLVCILLALAFGYFASVLRIRT